MHNGQVEGVDPEERNRFAGLMDQIERFKSPLMSILSRNALDPLGPYLPLLGPLSRIRRMGADDMTALMRIPPMAVADWMRDALGNERVRAGLSSSRSAGRMAGSMVSLERGELPACYGG